MHMSVSFAEGLELYHFFNLNVDFSHVKEIKCFIIF